MSSQLPQSVTVLVARLVAIRNSGQCSVSCAECRLLRKLLKLQGYQFILEREWCRGEGERA